MKRVLAVLACGAVLSIAGCGGDDGGTAGTGGTGGSDGEFCDLLRTFEDHSNALDAAFAGTPEALKELMSGMRQEIADLEPVAPDEIRDDMALMGTTFTRFIDFFEEHDYDVQAIAASPDFPALQQELSSAEITDAGSRLDDYGVNVCGIPAQS